MATVTVSTNSILDSGVSYAAGDTLSVTLGATLTIRKSTTINIGALNTSEGTILIDSTTAGAVVPIVVQFNSSTNGMSISSLGLLKCIGGWYSLGTGNGASGQTFTHFHATAPPFVQVETAAGSGIYTTCLNIYTNAFSTVGPGTVLGAFFQYTESSSTITFGNGSNGMVVPTGANVRVPNILITSAAAYNATVSSRGTIAISGVGNFWGDKVSFSDRMYCNWLGIGGLYCRDVGAFSWFRISQSNSVDVSGLYIASDRASATNTSVSFSTIKGTVYNLVVASYQSACFDPSGSSITLENPRLFVLARSAASSATVYASITVPAFTINNGISAGGKIRGGFLSLTIKDLQVSDTMTGINDTTVISYGLQIDSVNTLNIDGITLVPGGTAPRDAFLYISSCNTTRIKNINADLSNSAFFINLVSNNTSTVISNCSIGSPRTRPVESVVSNGKVILSNITGITTLTPKFYGNDVRVYGCVSGKTSLNTSFAGASDIASAICYDSGTTPTTGSIQLFFVPEKMREYFAVTSGTPFMDKGGTMVMRTVGDEIVLSLPDTFYGITSFINSAPTVPSTSYMSCFYQIQPVGGSWSSWLVLNETNLSAEAISSTVGFNLKIKITTIQAGTNAFTNIVIPVNVDSTYIYPVEFSSIVISANTSLVGAEIRIYDLDNSPVGSLGTELAGTESHIAATYTYTGTPGNTIWIQIMQSGYEEFGQAWNMAATDSTFYATLKTEQNA
jgi:hypothetical protein